MATFDLFSKRQKRLRGEIPEIYQYSDIPNALRIQIIHIIKDAIGIDKGRIGGNKVNEVYKSIHDTLCREYGVFTLGNPNRNEPDQNSLFTFFLATKDYEKVIDIIEISFLLIKGYIDNPINNYKFHADTLIKPDDAIQELNERFREHGVGYQFESSQIIRVDSTYMHSEVVNPSIKLLWNDKFLGANDEYMKAHEHYRNGRNKECLAECLKAYESTMKIICKESGWPYKETDTSKKLIEICLQNGIIPQFIQNQYTSIRNLLESGIPTIRNRLGGHGQGQTQVSVDDQITRYALNLTGSNIIFLIEQSGIK
jgi:hypothetical protein